MRIQYRARSLADIDEIFSYIDQRSPSGALNVLHAIFDGIQRIADNPYAWQATDDPEIRVFAPSDIATGYSMRSSIVTRWKSCMCAIRRGVRGRVANSAISL
jgi:hypothetical protein